MSSKIAFNNHKIIQIAYVIPNMIFLLDKSTLSYLYVLFFYSHDSIMIFACIKTNCGKFLKK